MTAPTRCRTRLAVSPLRGPDRQQNRHDVGGVDAIHALVADLRHGVVPQAGAPLRGGLAAVLPVLGVDPDDLLDGLLEGRRADSEVAGILALGDDPRVGERLLPRAGERDDRVRAEAHVGGLPVEAYPLRPGLGEAAGGGGFDKKAQAVSTTSIAVAPGNVDGVDEGGGESLGAVHRRSHYHLSYHNYGKYARIAKKRQETKNVYLS